MFYPRVLPLFPLFIYSLVLKGENQHKTGETEKAKKEKTNKFSVLNLDSFDTLVQMK